MPKLHAAGVIRCIQGDWYILNDAGHESYNLTDVSSDSARVLVSYPPMTKIVSAWVNPDETYAKHKIMTGVSVGLDQAAIQFAKSNSTTEVVLNPAGLGYASSNVWFGVFCSDSCQSCL